VTNIGNVRVSCDTTCASAGDGDTHAAAVDTEGNRPRCGRDFTVTGGCSVFTCYHIEFVKRIYWLCVACILLVYSSYSKSCGKTYKASVNIYISGIYDIYNVCAAYPTSQGSASLRRVLIKYSPQVPNDPISVNHGASPRTISESPIIQHDSVKLAARRRDRRHR
jgi:hypothetical protein